MVADMPPIPFRLNPMGLHIPGGYTRVNYIETASTSQWIDTNQNGKGIFLDGLSYRYDIILLTRIRFISSYNWSAPLFAAKINWDTGAVAFCSSWQSETGVYKGVYYTQANTGTVRNYVNYATISDKPNTILLSNVDDLKIDSLLGLRWATGGWYNAHSSESGAVRFFKNIKRDREGYALSSPTGSSLYECVIKRNGVEVSHLVPCLDQNGRPCLYDLISKNTYYNSGTGEFLYG